MTEEQVNKLEIIKHITLGTSEVLYYPYNNGREPLPLRPLSSFELDQCLFNSLANAPEKIAELVIKLRLKFIKPDQNINVSDEGYANLQKFYHLVDYWVVYYAMKDFQDEEFSKPNFETENLIPKGFSSILKMNEVHEISNFVLDASIQPKEVIKEIVSDEYGKQIGYAVYFLKQPLAQIKDLTKLQQSYLLYSKGEVRKIDKTKDYIISGETMTIEELLKRFR
jgi:hypothetical protein